jgi:hypothetical protein
VEAQGAFKVQMVAAWEGNADGACTAVAHSRDRKRDVGPYNEDRDGLSDDSPDSRLGSSGGSRARRGWTGWGRYRWRCWRWSRW